jgi:hypothetical protein
MARKRIVTVEDATVTLSKNQSGSLVVLNRAAGIVVTLPDVGRGLTYDFVMNVDASGAHEIRTNDLTSMHGILVMDSSSGAQSMAGFGGDETTTAFSMNGTTTGGKSGSRITAVCDEDGTWHVQGTLLGSGTLATPFYAPAA